MTRCACKGAELSCVIGNIFTELRPPCDMCGAAAVIRGVTPSGHEAALTITAAGFDFEGCAEDTAILTETGAVIRKVRRRSKNNERRKLKKMRGLLDAGRIEPGTVEQSYQSWRGHASKGNCYHLVRNMDQYFTKLFGQTAVVQKHGGGSALKKEERR